MKDERTSGSFSGDPPDSGKLECSRLSRWRAIADVPLAQPPAIDIEAIKATVFSEVSLAFGQSTNSSMKDAVKESAITRFEQIASPQRCQQKEVEGELVAAIELAEKESDQLRTKRDGFDRMTSVFLGSTRRPLLESVQAVTYAGLLLCLVVGAFKLIQMLIEASGVAETSGAWSISLMVVGCPFCFKAISQVLANDVERRILLKKLGKIALLIWVFWIPAFAVNYGEILSPDAAIVDVTLDMDALSPAPSMSHTDGVKWGSWMAIGFLAIGLWGDVILAAVVWLALDDLVKRRRCVTSQRSKVFEADDSELQFVENWIAAAREILGLVRGRIMSLDHASVAHGQQAVDLYNILRMRMCPHISALDDPKHTTNLKLDPSILQRNGGSL